jgi:hypothetical protein
MLKNNQIKLSNLIKLLLLCIILINFLSMRININCRNTEKNNTKYEENDEENNNENTNDLNFPRKFEEEEYKLIEINEENFEEKIKKAVHFLLLIHNPWCKYSQKLSDKLLKVHKFLKLESQEYYIGAIDSTINNIEKFNEKFLQSKNFIFNNFYPKLIYFHNGEPKELYNDKQNQDTLLTYIKRKIYPESINIPILSIFDYKVIHDKTAFIYVDTLTQKQNITHKEKLISKEGFELFNKYAKKFPNLMFYYTNNKLVADNLFEKNENSNFRNSTIYKRDFNVLYFSKGKLLDVHLNEKLKVMFDKSFNHFINKQIKNNFYTKFTEDAINEIFIKNQTAFFLFRNPYDNSTLHLEENLPLLASQESNMKFVVTDIIGKFELKLINLLLVSPKDLPQIRIIDFKGGFRKFDNREGIEIENVIQFIRSYKNGNLKPYYSTNNNIELNSKSELKNIGNGNFFEKVLKNKRNILVFYYTKWCQHCKKVNLYFNI